MVQYEDVASARLGHPPVARSGRRSGVGFETKRTHVVPLRGQTLQLLVGSIRRTIVYGQELHTVSAEGLLHDRLDRSVDELHRVVRCDDDGDIRIQATTPIVSAELTWLGSAQCTSRSRLGRPSDVGC